MSNRETDINGYITIRKNPISKVGVFPYLGKNIDAALEPNKVYFVYRPAEELCKPETIESFKNIPIIDDHQMLGTGQTPAERKGVEGATGGDVMLDGDYLYADLHIYSDTLKRKIDNDKKDLSIGYRVGRWEPMTGLFNGQPYDYIQRELRGNHVAVVQEGRSGKDVAVLDATIVYDHMDIVEDAVILTSGYRVAWKKKSMGSMLRFTIYYATKEEADRKADEITRGGDYVSSIEHKEGAAKDTASDSTTSPAAEKKGEVDNNKKGANDMADKEDKEEKKTSMDDVKAFMKDFAKDRKAFDKLMDEMTPKEKAEEKKAEDEKGDTEEKKGDQKEAKDDKDEEKKDDKKAEDKSAMDSAIIGLRAEIASLKKDGLKTLMGELNKRNEVAKTVEAQFGTFDHAELTAGEVAAYGLKKAGISAPAGSEIAVWDAYSAGRKTVAGRQVAHAVDAKESRAPVGSLIEKTLAASK